MTKVVLIASAAFASVAAAGVQQDIPAFETPLTNPALLHVKVSAAPKHEPLELVKDGKVMFVILYDKSAEKDMTYAKANRRCITPAVETLRRFVEEATGDKVVVADVSEAQKFPGKLKFLVGESELTRRLGLTSEGQESEGYVLSTFGEGVAIVGNDSSLIPDYYREPGRLWSRGPRKGTLFGVYDFLERFFGCRFYYPGPEGRVIPKVTDLVIAPCRYSDAPHIRNRGGCYLVFRHDKVKSTLMYDFPADEMQAYQMAMRWSDNVDPFPTAHSPHPAPYALANSNDIETVFFRSKQGHLYQSYTSHPANYFDVTNLKTADCFVESLKRFYASGGKDEQGWRCVSGYRIPIGQCDCELPLGIMMENETVRKLGLITEENRRLGPSGLYADIYGRFHQYIARRMKKEFPEQRMTLIGYNSYTWPPRQAKYRPLPDNVDASLAFRDMPRFYRNAKKRAECEALLKDWRDWMGGFPVQGLWCYNGGNSCFSHAIANSYLGEMMRGFGDDLGRLCVFPEFQMHGNPLSSKYVSPLLYYYQTYAGMRMLWDPSFDHHAAYDELWCLMYGEEAGAHLKKLYSVLEESFEKYAVPSADEKALYPMPVLAEIEAELDAAGALVKGDAVRERRFRLIEIPLRGELKIHRLQHTTARPVAIVPLAECDDWPKSPCVPFIDPHGSGEKPPVEPKLRLAWSDDALKGILETDFKPEAGKDFWGGDTVELFLSPGDKKDWYCQICFDSTGRTISSCRKLLPIPGPVEGEWRPEGMTHSAEPTEKGWRLTFEIPFSALPKKPCPYERWRFACVYNSCRPRGPRGMAATSLLLMNNHNPDRWGELLFLGHGDEASETPKDEKVSLEGGLKKYEFRYSKDNAFGLTAPRHSLGFGIQGSRFLDLNVDGTWLSSAFHGGKPFEVQEDKRGTTAVREVNIDGHRFIVRFKTKKGSPLLFVSVVPCGNSVEFRNATIRVNCVPSVMNGQNGYANVAYARYAETAKGRCGPGALGPDDRYVLLGDDNYDGSGDRKGYGPSFLRLPKDWRGVRAARVSIGDRYNAYVEFDLEPGGRGVSFAIHQPSNRMTRDDVLSEVGLDEAGPLGIKAVWTSTESKGVPTCDVLPDSAFMGNGDLGLVNDDFAIGKRFVVTKGDFLSGGSFGRKRDSGLDDFRAASVGFLKVSLEEAMPPEDTLSIGNGTLTSRFGIPDGGVAEMRTFIARDRNVIVCEIEGAENLRVAVVPQVPDINGFPCGNGTLPNGDAFAWRRTLNTSGGAEGSWRSEVAMVSRLVPGVPLRAVTAVYCARQCFDAHDKRIGEDAVAKAEELLEATLSEGLADVRKDHDDWWSNYWSRGSISIGDEKLERYYYGSLYVLAVAAPFGYSHIAPGLYGTIVTTDSPLWQNDLHLNYNYQSPFYGVCAANRPEFIRGLVEPVLEYLPQAKWNARHELDCIDAAYVSRRRDLEGGIDGALYPVSIFPQGGRDPRRRMRYWNQTMNAPLTAALFCTYWEYTQDREFWKRVYPFLKATADFYVRWCERETAPDGSHVYALWDSAYEGEYFGKNCSPTLGFVRHLFRTLADSDEDAGLVRQWRDYAEHLAEWPIRRFRWEGFDRRILALADTDDPMRMVRGIGAVELEGIVPGEAFSFDVTPGFREFATNAVDAIIARGGLKTLICANQTPKLYVSAIRAGYPCERVIDWFKRYQIDAYGRKNFTLRDGVHGIEKSGGIEFIQSMLLQCDNGCVKLFPNWTGEDASFERLRAKGAFLVSAEMEDGCVSSVRVESLNGGVFRMVNPFGDSVPNGWSPGMTRHSGERTIERRFAPGEAVVVAGD